MTVGFTFFAFAVRAARKSDIVALIATALATLAFGYSTGGAEPVFVGNGGLNRGVALFLAVLGILVGLSAVILTHRLRRIRVLLLIAAAGILVGDVAGWLERSSAPSKYDHPIGLVLPAAQILTAQSETVCEQEIVPPALIRSLRWKASFAN